MPEAYMSLRSTEQTVLVEVACSQDSVLSHTMRQLTGRENSSKRLSIWNQYDLTVGAGVKSILDEIDQSRPQHVWLSPDCGPYSPMQNINQRSPEQVQALQEKRRYALKQYVGCAIIFHYCAQRGIDVTWELSQHCHAWRLPILQRLVSKYQLGHAVIRGCQVGLRDSHGELVSKGWKIISTNQLLLSRMELPCRCSPNTKHVGCEGNLTKKSAWYTPAFGKRVCEAILQGVSAGELQNKLLGHEPQKGSFGEGLHCVCHEGHVHEAQVTCGYCTEGCMNENMGHAVMGTHEVDSKERERESVRNCTFFMLPLATVP